MATSKILGELILVARKGGRSGHYPYRVEVPQQTLQSTDARNWLLAILGNIRNTPITLGELSRDHFDITVKCENRATAHEACELFLSEVVEIASHRCSDTQWFARMASKTNRRPLDIEMAKAESGELNVGEVRAMSRF